MTDNQAVYRVLARKYRPQTFEDLIGQDPVVQTLANAFETDRIAQAYMLTGVRGVGKTTTARLIARALNYDTGGDSSGSSIQMSEYGAHCQAILESRHVDVIEMDAASRTSVDDIREIIESVRYKPVSARYKIYIIDEVHMLSTNAFNALLKTLEEPPEHVKFILATTEIRKVPVTVLSRCQRFDLRRLGPELLIEHFRKIAELEKVKVEDEALALIARASEGSVRDGLSLLDQAITFGGDEIKAEELRHMLGLADRDRIIDLFETLMKGDAAKSLAELDEQHSLGTDPETVLTDLAELVHWITRLKIVPEADSDVAHSPSERKRGVEFASSLSMPILTRVWQMLLKGIQEVKLATNPSAAAEMVLIRIAFVAELPPPAAAIERMTKTTATASQVQSSPVPQAGNKPVTEARAQTQLAPSESEHETSATPPPPEPVALSSFTDIVALASERRDIRLKTELETQIRLVSFAPGRLEIGLQPGTRSELPNELTRKLEQWTSKRWVVVVSDENGEAPITEQKAEQRQSLFRQARENETVKAVLEKFPGAEIIDVRDLTETENEPEPDADTASEINED